MLIIYTEKLKFIIKINIEIIDFRHIYILYIFKLIKLKKIFIHQLLFDDHRGYLQLM